MVQKQAQHDIPGFLSLVPASKMFIVIPYPYPYPYQSKLLSQQGFKSLPGFFLQPEGGEKMIDEQNFLLSRRIICFRVAKPRKHLLTKCFRTHPLN